MKQGVLAGRTEGLRPSLRRRLERLCHRRHAVESTAEGLTLQRLAGLSHEMETPLTLVVDGRGLGRLLWVGPLETSTRLLEKLPGSERRQGNDFRVLTCCGRSRRLEPGAQEGIVGLDLAPRLWLRFADQAAPGGHWPAALFVPSGQGEPWRCLEQGDLLDLCDHDPAALEETAALEPPRTARSGQERVLLLALTPAQPETAAREIAELEGLVRSAGAEPVGLVSQRRQHAHPQSLWGEGKLTEAALEARRLGATLVVTDRELSPVQGRTLEQRLSLPVSDRSELILDIFAQRAASAAGRLQVELAQLRYRLPRLTGRGQSLSRQGGGNRHPRAGGNPAGEGPAGDRPPDRASAAAGAGAGGTSGPAAPPAARSPPPRPGGYTNAGKSSLLNALTRRQGTRRWWRRTSCSPPWIPPRAGSS